MKPGWQKKSLADVCLVDKSQGMHKSLPYVGLEHIESHTGRFIGSTEPVGVKSSTFKFSPEHLLYGRLRPYLNKVMLPDFAGHCSTEIFPLKPRPGLLREFLQYWFLRDATVEQIDATSTGARMPRANMNAVLTFEFPLPSLPEQRRIVGILDEAFEGIAIAKANAEKNLRNARALFESYLEAIITQRGEGWVEKRLEEICERVSVGHVGPTSEFYCGQAEGVPFLRSQNVRRGRLDWDGIQFVTKEFHQRLRKSQLRTGDLLFVRVGANRGDCCSVPEDVGDVNCANIVFARPIEGNAVFLERYCGSTHGREQLLGMTTGSAQGVINTHSVADLVIPIPTPLDQKRIVDSLNELQSETRRLESIYRRKIEGLEDLKKSLLQEAFCGRL